MRLPKNLFGGYTKPDVYLCETDKTKIAKLQTTNTKLSLKFNSISEASFEVGRTYNDILTGEIQVNPFYNKIESPRLILIDNIGYFEIQGPGMSSDGIKEEKSITAKSAEYTLSTKYLDNFYINTGEVDSVEVIYADSHDTTLVPVTLYNPTNTELSLLHLILEKDYSGWTIGHVDDSLWTLSRSFEVDRMSIYDFIINEICQKFNCYAVFDTFTNTINIYAESLTSKFIGDGETNVFTISPPFSKVGTVSVDGYKTTQWEYNTSTGALTLGSTPVSGAHIEVIDGALEQWETDVFVAFDNLATQIDITYDADEIKTQLTVTYGDNGDIREANLGLPYLTDLSYFYTVDWMGQDLYDAYTAYLQKSNTYQNQYTVNSQKMIDLAGQIDFEENRLSLEYSIALVGPETVGTYYTRGGTDPNYYYTEVSLPAEYNAEWTYYSLDTANLNEDKVGKLFTVFKSYFYNYYKSLNSKDVTEAELAEQGMQDAIVALDALEDDFEFMENHTLAELSDAFKSTESDAFAKLEIAINTFLGDMWRQIGRTPLKMLYKEPYKQVQIANIEAGWSKVDDDNYGNYYPVVLMLNSIETAIAERTIAIEAFEQEYKTIQNENITIRDELLINNNFTKGQLVRLSAFLREDELHLDEIVETSQDSVSDSFKIKQDAMESGRITLNKMCQPRLQFTMSMANIYALPEFEPIIDQFQLGRVIKVGIRPDYIMQSRLMQVDIGLDDLSDFSCQFGDLTNLRTQSDIHADLLKNAIQAGKSVATNASSWTKGSEQANSIDLRLQEGLLNSIDALKNIDGNQNAYMDKWGLHLEAVNPDTGEVSDKRVWLVNNQIVFTDDGFKTSKSVLGEFTVDGIQYYGLLAQAVISGYIEGSTMKGGTIQIGEQPDGTYAFEVREDGSVTMGGGSTINGYAKEEDVAQQIQDVKSTSTIISDTQPADANDGQLWINTSTYPYTVMVFSKENKDEEGKWVNFSQNINGAVYTSMPSEYKIDDLWIVSDGDVANYADVYQELFSVFKSGSILRATETSSSFNSSHWTDAIEDITTTIANVKESFTWNANGIQVAKRVTDENGHSTHPFYVHIDSTRMGFHSVEYNDDSTVKDDVEVVHIGNNSATIQNATFEGSAGTTFNNAANFNQQINLYKPNSTTEGFTLKVETNGSFSIGILE